MVELQDKFDSFKNLDTVVVAVSQEDRDLESATKFLQGFKPDLPFTIVADFNREKTQAYDRTTAYFMDKSGKVRQVFPMLIHERASWDPILTEIKSILAQPPAQKTSY